MCVCAYVCMHVLNSISKLHHRIRYTRTMNINVLTLSIKLSDDCIYKSILRGNMAPSYWHD